MLSINESTDTSKNKIADEALSIRYDVLKLTLSSKPLKKLLDSALKRILSVSWLNLQNKGGIFLISSSGHQLNLAASHNLGPQIEKTCNRVILGHCLCGRAAQEKTLQFASCVDKRHDVRFDGMEPHGHYNVPILSKKKSVVGVLVLYLPHGHKKSALEIEFVEDIAKSLAALIEQKTMVDTLRTYAKAIDHHAIVSATDTKGKIIHANDKFCEISGYSRKELLGQDHNILKSGHHKKSEIKEMFSEIAKGNGWTGVFCNKSKSGKNYWVDTTIIPTRNPLGRISGYLSARIDVTEIHEQQIAFAKKNFEFDLALENMSMGISLFDFDQKLVFCNSHYQDFFGLPNTLIQQGTSQKEIVDFVIDRDRFSPQTTDKYLAVRDEKLHKLKSGELGVSHHILTDRETGRHIKITTKGVKRFGWVSTYNDITESVQREKYLVEATKKAQVAEKAKSEFLSTMSHELLTPLNGVLGIASLLAISPLDEEQKQLVTVIEKSGNLLSKMVNDMLDYTDLEVGKTEAIVAPFHLESITIDLVTLLSPLAAERGIKLIIDFDPSLPAKFVGDANLVRQILSSLIENAIKFTEVGWVRIKVTGLVSEDVVQMNISVQDTGIGISKPDLNRVFSLFTQIDSSNTRTRGGTGLGLAVAERLALLVGGKIEVESTVNEGSTFTLSIPLYLPPTSGA